jgi:hypothetical protein
MTVAQFKAWDRINNKYINLWKINISKEGQIMSVEDLEGELYGLHQIRLAINL